MAVKALFALAFVVAVVIGLTLPGKQVGPKTAQVSQLTLLTLR